MGRIKMNILIALPGVLLIHLDLSLTNDINGEEYNRNSYFDEYLELMNPWHATRKLIYPQFQLPNDQATPLITLPQHPDLEHLRKYGMNKQNQIMNILRQRKNKKKIKIF